MFEYTEYTACCALVMQLVIGLQSKETALLPFGNCTLLTGLVSGVDIPVYLRTQSSSTRILVANISSLCDDGHFNTFFITRWLRGHMLSGCSFHSF